MAPPPISLFLTTIASAPALRQRQEYLLRTLQVRKVPFTSYDLASDEQAKKLWRRKAPPGKQELPGILVGSSCPGTFADFEEAVEYGELDQFLRLKDDWDPEIEGDSKPPPPVQAVGVPGVVMPYAMTNQKASFSTSPQPSPSKKGEIDIGKELGGFGLEGVKVTEDEMAELVRSLGLGGDDADDLLKGLGFGDTKDAEPEEVAAKVAEPKGEVAQAKEDDKGEADQKDGTDHTKEGGAAAAAAEEPSKALDAAAKVDAPNTSEKVS